MGTDRKLREQSERFQKVFEAKQRELEIAQYTARLLNAVNDMAVNALRAIAQYSSDEETRRMARDTLVAISDASDLGGEQKEAPE